MSKVRQNYRGAMCVAIEKARYVPYFKGASRTAARGLHLAFIVSLRAQVVQVVQDRRVPQVP